MSSKIIAAFAVLAMPLVAFATEYQTVERPRQECWNEQVAVQAAYPNVGGAIVGGLAGGLLGNQIGNGNGRTLATALGAVTGAVVGDRMTSYGPAYQNVKRCRTVYDQVQIPVMQPPVQYTPPVQYMQPPVQYMPQPVQYLPQPVQIIEQQPAYYVVPGRSPRYYREPWDRGWHGRRQGHHDRDED
jgi:uncharacterized protein YcfJ